MALRMSAERMDDGWQRVADSLIKYGLIGMGFSLHHVYLLCKHQDQGCSEWRQTEGGKTFEQSCLSSNFTCRLKPEVNVFLFTS